MLDSIYHQSIEQINNIRARQQTLDYPRQWPCGPEASRRQWTHEPATLYRQRPYEPGAEQLDYIIAQQREYAQQHQITRRHEIARKPLPREDTQEQEPLAKRIQEINQRANERAQQQKPQRSPDTVTEINTLAQWNRIIESSKEKPVVVLFTQQRCPPCIPATADFNNAAAKYTGALFAKVDVNNTNIPGIDIPKYTPTFKLYLNNTIHAMDLSEIITIIQH